MIKKILFFSGCFFLAITTYANDYGNPITIYNNTNYNIAYEMEGNKLFNNVYGIPIGMSDLYHSKDGDRYATLNVGVCNQFKSDGIWGLECSQYTYLHNCTNGNYYNATLISSIAIDSLNSCKVVCIDGDTESCKQSS